jgi:hypothetical protein
VADEGTMRDHIADLMQEVAELHATIRSLRASVALSEAKIYRWKQVAEAYERGDMAAADELFKTAMRVYG